MQRKVQVELNPAYKVNQFTRRLAIFVNNRVVAVVDTYDEPGLNSPCDEGSTLQRIRDLNPPLILKYQWQPLWAG